MPRMPDRTSGGGNPFRASSEKLPDKCRRVSRNAQPDRGCDAATLHGVLRDADQLIWLFSDGSDSWRVVITPVARAAVPRPSPRSPRFRHLGELLSHALAVGRATRRSRPSP